MRSLKWASLNWQQVLAGAAFLLTPWGRICLPAFPAPRGCPYSLVHGPLPSIFKASDGSSLLTLHLSSPHPAFLFTWRAFGTHRTTRHTQNNLLSQGHQINNLNSICILISPYHAIWFVHGLQCAECGSLVRRRRRWKVTPFYPPQHYLLQH